MQDFWSISSLLSAFVSSAALCFCLQRPAIKLGLIDHPDIRKQHDRPTPLVGGVAMYCAILLTVLLNDSLELRPSFLVGSSLFLLIGLLDDRFELAAMPRLLLQILAISVATIPNEIQLDHLGWLLGNWNFQLGIFALPITIIGMIGVSNAVNMSDGIDGLSGSISLIALLFFGLSLYLIGSINPPGRSLIESSETVTLLIGAVAGFLLFNLRSPWRQRASIFMGDAGSMFLGYSLAWLAVFTSNELEHGGIPPVTTLWILAVPLFDTVSCMIRRVLAGHSPMRPDRNHWHHLLLRKGYKPSQVVGTLSLFGAMSGALGIIGWQAGVPDRLMFIAFIVAFAVFTRLILVQWARLETMPAQSAETLLSPAPGGTGD